MNSALRKWGAALLAGVVALGVSVSSASAQMRFPQVATPSTINPAFVVAPGIQQYSNLVNSAILGRTIRQIPPWAFGNNGFGSPIGNAGLGGVAPIYPSSLYGGYGGYGGYPTSAGLTTGGTGYGSTLTTSAEAANYGYGAGYGSAYGGYMDPNYGFLSGSADVINAQGVFMNQAQQARLTQTQADEGRLDYRRRLIDEARYERGLSPTTDELHQQQLARNLDWARHEPPITDIASARTLNDLLHHLTSDPAVGKGPSIPLDEDVLRRINVTSPLHVGDSLGLVKDAGRLQWPQSLTGNAFEGPRKDLSDRLQEVVRGLNNSTKPELGALNDLTKDVTKLRDLVDKSELSPTEYLQARNYLDQVDSAVRALGDENVVANFNNKFPAKNVAELVDYMKTKGLDFAPAAPGDEGAYRTLQQALVAFDYGASPRTASQAPPMAPAGLASIRQLDRGRSPSAPAQPNRLPDVYPQREPNQSD
jgi:hypothetical protein